MGIIIKNPTIIKKGGGTDYLGLRLSQTTEYSYENNSITEIPLYAFYYDKKITSISCSSVTYLHERAFHFASNLASANFPALTRADSAVFFQCDALTSISFPLLTTINGSFCNGCDNLVTVNLPEATTLPSQCFQNCISLVNVSFPKVTTISSGAFYGCTALESITLNANQVCSLANVNAIPATSAQHITIYVPSNLIASYQTAANWSTLYNSGYITFSPISD